MIKLNKYKKNFLLDKLSILEDNKYKSGIYIIYNNINNKIYIGRSMDLKRRFMFYYNIKNLNREVTNGNSRICDALLIYGYINFSLEILEYCDKKYLNERKQYNLYLFQPEYNIRGKSGKIYKFS